MEAGDAVSVIARRHAMHGTTSMLATTMTAPLGDIEAALTAMADVIRQRPAGTARVLGVHLEDLTLIPVSSVRSLISQGRATLHR
jgi:N-acetylglucosamine-6-phosphate deacetylase